MDKRATSSSEHEPLHVVIAGGSIAGLMAGILLRRRGHRVTIYEQSTISERTGMAAGIGMSAQIRKFFENNDRIKDVPLGTSIETMLVLQADMTVIRKIHLVQSMTTWDSIYYRLRANFDSFQSPYCPNAPRGSEDEGPGAFESGMRVTAVDWSVDGRPLVTVQDVSTAEEQTQVADYLIGADGVHSTLRRILLPGLKRSEPGYCIWRGTVPTSELSNTAREALDSNFVSYQLPNSYAIIYAIPGVNGSLKNGKRDINFAWYQYYHSAEELREILTDSDGRVHRTTLPKGKMRTEIWQRSIDTARRDMHPTIFELIEKVQAPFVSIISSIAPRRASFMNDRVFLVGDGLFQIQPNSGQGSNMAAFGATTLATTINKAVNTASEAERRSLFRDWEYKVLDRGAYERLRSILWANIFFRNRLATAFWTLRLKLLEWSINTARWWRWLFRLGGHGKDGYVLD